MSALIRFINSKLKPYTTIIIALFMLLVISLIGLFLYSKNQKENKENPANFSNISNIPNAANNGIIEVMFFHVTWCPHCVSAQPEWTAFENEMKNYKVNNFQIKCISHDCTDESSDLTKSIINEYNIDSFPTVIIMKENVRYDFDSKVTNTALKKFVTLVTTK